jgi:hypothetical protein
MRTLWSQRLHKVQLRRSLQKSQWFPVNPFSNEYHGPGAHPTMLHRPTLLGEATQTPSAGRASGGASAFANDAVIIRYCSLPPLLRREREWRPRKDHAQASGADGSGRAATLGAVGSVPLSSLSSANTTCEMNASGTTPDCSSRASAPSLLILLMWPRGLRCGQLANLYAHSRVDFCGSAVVHAIVDTHIRYLLQDVPVVVQLRAAPLTVKLVVVKVGTGPAPISAGRAGTAVSSA